jgi:hypothetical protein
MRANRATICFTALVLCSCWLAVADRGARADDKADVKAKIKELQKQRLEAATKARDFLFNQLERGYIPSGAADTSVFFTQLVLLDKLVHEARLDLSETRAERIKATEQSIKQFEPIVAQFEKRYKEGIGNATVTFHLAEVHLLEMKIALEKAKLETGKP